CTRACSARAPDRPRSARRRDRDDGRQVTDKAISRDPDIPPGNHMTKDITPNGTIALIDGVRRIHYDGYWLKYYDPPADSLQTKKILIQALTRRLFNHVEHGINIPGKRLAEARASYETEQD